MLSLEFSQIGMRNRLFPNNLSSGFGSLLNFREFLL